MTARTLYHQHKAAIPDHTMHVYARLVVTLYLTRRYGPDLVRRHSALIARALHNTDGSK